MPENKRIVSPLLLWERGNIRALATASKWVRGPSACVILAPILLPVALHVVIGVGLLAHGADRSIMFCQIFQLIGGRLVELVF